MAWELNVNKKLLEIYDFYHASLKLFKVQGSSIEVWVYIQALPSEAKRGAIEKWLKNHIREEGVSIKDFEIEDIVSIIDYYDPTKKRPKFIIEI